ncbi:uracil-DNA glycosylase family protein [Porphyromonas pogonae]|uniref:uracil-DNA glycosylase family protein n=1 Tax=Porphyromonas pogonae TaxID=867595 RepID=UPI002E7A2861|nr:uracil-DNA glycosylase family protein [Porphyromonas pogonae]
MTHQEVHPLGFFIPPNAQLLMLGSFPPPRAKWSMDFYYPNFINDMWRILGTIFFDDKDHFIVAGEKRFSKELCAAFCDNMGIAIGDTAVEITRLQGNAADKHLQIDRGADIKAIISSIPECRAIVVTGQKALDTLLLSLGETTQPQLGGWVSLTVDSREIRLYRMPSSSRAYPLPLLTKCMHYKSMFEELGMLLGTPTTTGIIKS